MTDLNFWLISGLIYHDIRDDLWLDLSLMVEDVVGV